MIFLTTSHLNSCFTLHCNWAITLVCVAPHNPDTSLLVNGFKYVLILLLSNSKRVLYQCLAAEQMSFTSVMCSNVIHFPQELPSRRSPWPNRVLKSEKLWYRLSLWRESAWEIRVCKNIYESCVGLNSARPIPKISYEKQKFKIEE